MIRISQMSGDYYKLRDRMRRARRLWVLVYRRAIEQEGEDALRRCAQGMIEHGLKRGHWLDAEYTVLRILHFMDAGLPYHSGRGRGLHFMAWHNWLNEKGWRRTYARGDRWVRSDRGVSS